MLSFINKEVESKLVNIIGFEAFFMNKSNNLCKKALLIIKIWNIGLRDADMAKISSTYIQQKILQEASATLMATVNQIPSVALQLLLYFINI